MRIEDDLDAARLRVREKCREPLQLRGVERPAERRLHPLPFEWKPNQFDAVRLEIIELRAVGIDVVVTVSVALTELSAGQIHPEHSRPSVQTADLNAAP